MGERPTQLTSDDPDEIRAEIQQTRAEMSDTIDAIQERISPEYLKQQARDKVRDAAVGQYEDARDSVKGASLTMWETIKQNPIPSALVGVGLGWLYMNRSSGPSYETPQGHYRYRGDQPSYGARYSDDPYDIQYGEYGERYGRESTSSGSGSSASQQGSDTMRDAQHRFGEMAGEMRERTEHAGQAIQQQVQSTSSQLERMFYQNPLGLGLVAVGAGVIAGLAVPETQREHELMGPARDQLLDQAKDRVQDTMERVEHVAEEAQHAAQEEAREQGLSE